jgi:DNA-binding CsgD family transcriptional regulator
MGGRSSAGVPDVSAAEDTSPKRVGGRPLTTLTDAQRAEVETLSAVLNAEQIADFLGIGRTTFFAILNRDEDLSERYKRGKARAIGAVAQSLVTKARAGNVTAMIFFLKTQGGWRESVDLAVKQDPIDEIDLSQLSDNDLRELMEYGQKLESAKKAILDARKEKADGRWSIA